MTDRGTFNASFTPCTVKPKHEGQYYIREYETEEKWVEEFTAGKWGKSVYRNEKHCEYLEFENDR